MPHLSRGLATNTHVGLSPENVARCKMLFVPLSSITDKAFIRVLKLMISLPCVKKAKPDLPFAELAECDVAFLVYYFDDFEDNVPIKGHFQVTTSRLDYCKIGQSKKSGSTTTIRSCWKPLPNPPSILVPVLPGRLFHLHRLVGAISTDLP